MDMPLLKVEVLRSHLLAAALVAVHGAAAACVALYVPHWAAIAVGFILAASLVFYLRRDTLLLAGDSITDAVLRDDANCELHCRDGRVMLGTLARSSFVSVWLVTLVVRLDSGRVRTLVLLPDSAPINERRRLRVWLRFRLRWTPGSAGA